MELNDWPAVTFSTLPQHANWTATGNGKCSEGHCVITTNFIKQPPPREHAKCTETLKEMKERREKFTAGNNDRGEGAELHCYGCVTAVCCWEQGIPAAKESSGATVQDGNLTETALPEQHGKVCKHIREDKRWQRSHWLGENWWTCNYNICSRMSKTRWNNTHFMIEWRNSTVCFYCWPWATTLIETMTCPEPSQKSTRKGSSAPAPTAYAVSILKCPSLCSKPWKRSSLKPSTSFSTVENEQMCKRSCILQRTILATAGSYQYWRFHCQWFPGLSAPTYLSAPCTSTMPVSDLGLNTAKSWNFLLLSESYSFIQKSSAPSSGEKNLIYLYYLRFFIFLFVPRERNY